MKRIICLITALCLVLGSFSFCFATDISWNTTDSGHLTEIRNSLMSGGAIYNLINSCNTQLNNINYNLVTLMGWLDPSTGGSTTALLNQILNALTYTDAGGLVKSWLVDIQGYNYQTAERILDLKNLDNVSGFEGYGGQLYITSYGGRGQLSVFPWAGVGTWRGNMLGLLQTTNNNITSMLNAEYVDLLTGYNSSQTFTNWADLTSSTFTPTSTSNGIYTWFSKLQTPLARLSYVLASDERIEAQEAAAANEEAVVDNFIDSSGDGSASPSDIASISDLSAGYKDNFGSDASVSGIFNIFNSNNMGWFSQETANQLDTTTTTRRGSSFETPLLDQQIEDIYDQIGVKHD